MRPWPCGIAHTAAFPSRDREVLGLPSLFDHLFDMPPFPALARQRCRVLRTRPTTRTAERSRAPRVLGRRGPTGLGVGAAAPAWLRAVGPWVRPARPPRCRSA